MRWLWELQNVSKKGSPCKLPSWHDIYTGITKASILGLSWLSLTYWSDICEEVISNSVLLASISLVKQSEVHTAPKDASTHVNVVFPDCNSQIISQAISPKLFKDILKDFGLQGSDDDPAADIQARAEFVFEHVDTQVFGALAQAVEEWPLLQKKPKLSHNPANGVLFVEMLGATHEFSISDFSQAVLIVPTTPQRRGQTWSFFSQLNGPFSEENFLALPQSINACAAKLNEPTSTSGSHSINKPESSSPLDPSISAEQSKVETDIDSEAKLEPQPIEIKPIMVAGHTWCNIRDIQYHVWTKEDGAQRIDLDDRCFFKFIYPHIEMGEAEWVIRKGLSGVKKGIGELLSISASKSAVCRLQAADLRVDFNWRVIQAGVMASSWVTAWSHYQDWYFNMFHGTKHAHSDDDKYQPTESEVSSTSSEPQNTPPCSAAHHKLVHSSQPSSFLTHSKSAETQAPEGRGHPTHAHCLPQHYRDNDSEDFIDIKQELSIDVDDENCERQENVQPQATATHMASTDPLATRNSCQGQSRRNIAHDINYFFWEEVQEEESLSLCNICNYSYSAKSSTTMHHGHLDSQHPLVYLNKIEENNWPVQSKYLVAAFKRGCTFNMLREALNCPGTEISHLLPPPPPGVDNRVPVGKLPKGDPSVDLPEFSIQGLHEFLVNFIVSDDQRAIGAISFTADIWSADKLDSYLVMMAHWIRHESGSVQSHSGKEIVKAILHLIDHAEILVEKPSLDMGKFTKDFEEH
ncbi:hypothetical protein EDC04DRAFT_2597848 [Pisolithus marmoratus]|nr:hypothetical protein EDC04DRAFT_2597848 [Pisolithus marmoratus]